MPKIGQEKIWPIDPKYGIAIRGGEPVIVKTATGEAIPEDEPLILFRARDWNAPFQEDETTRYYEGSMKNCILCHRPLAGDIWRLTPLIQQPQYMGDDPDRAEQYAHAECIEVAERALQQRDACADPR